MACLEWRSRLELHLDGELPDAELPVLEAHLASCAGCTAEALRLFELQAGVREAGLRFAPSADLRQRVEADASGRRAPARAPWIAALAAAALAGFALALALGAPRGGSVAGELLDVHVATLASASPVDVVSTDAHTVKPWFAGRLPFSFDLPELRDSGFTLEGGRVAWLEGSPAAQLLYRVRKHRISVFVSAEETPLGRALAASALPGRERAFRLLSWREEGLRFAAVSDAGWEDLEKLATLFRGAAGP